MKVNLVLKTKELNGDLSKKNIVSLKKINLNSILYTFIDEYGKTSLEIFENSVIIDRSGKINSSIILKKNMPTTCNYKTEYFSSNLNLFTTHLDITELGFETRYVIYQGKEKINEIFLSLSEI